MPSRVPVVKVGESQDPEVDGILREWQDGWWGDANMFGVIAKNPDVLKATMSVMESFWPGNSKHNLTGHLIEMMRIKTADTRGCAYCSSVRTVAVRDMAGPKESEIAKFQPEPSDALSEREALAVCLAERMAIDPHTVDDAFFARLREHFSEEEIVELVFGSGVAVLGSSLAIALRLDSESKVFEYEDVLSAR